MKPIEKTIYFNKPSCSNDKAEVWCLWMNKSECSWQEIVEKIYSSKKFHIYFAPHEAVTFLVSLGFSSTHEGEPETESISQIRQIGLVDWMNEWLLIEWFLLINWCT